MALERAAALCPVTSSGRSKHRPRGQTGTRSERFNAAPSVPVIHQASRSTGGPRAPDHYRFWKLLGAAPAEEYERRARSRRAERARASQASCRLHASASPVPLTGRRGWRLPDRSTSASPPPRHRYPESPHRPRRSRTSSCPSHDSARRRPAQGARTGCCGRR